MGFQSALGKDRRRQVKPHGITAICGVCATFCAAFRKKSLIRWPERLLGPCPDLKETNLICWGLFAACMVAPLSVVLWSHWESGSLGDFVYFYSIGHLANERSGLKLYDYCLQLKAFNETEPLRSGTWGPSPYPPFVAIFFNLFARVPFRLAYLFWIGISLALYSVGIMAATKWVFGKEHLKSSLAFCFALAYPPFLMNTMMNGQLSSVAVCSIGLAFALERRSKPISSGLALSILTYKPTLLVLLLPMLLLTRRLKTFIGFVTGAGILVLASTAFMGVRVWPVYWHFLRYFGQLSQTEDRSLLARWQFVDLTSLSYALPGGRSRIGLMILIIVTIIVATWLATLLWKSSPGGEPVQYLAWATILTWTLLLNVYVPIYDSIVLTIALILTRGALRGPRWTDADSSFICFAILTIAVSWVSESIAKSNGIQLLTLLLVALGFWQAVLLDRAIRQKLSPDRQHLALRNFLSQ